MGRKFGSMASLYDWNLNSLWFDVFMEADSWKTQGTQWARNWLVLCSCSIMVARLLGEGYHVKKNFENIWRSPPVFSGRAGFCCPHSLTRGCGVTSSEQLFAWGLNHRYSSCCAETRLSLATCLTSTVMMVLPEVTAASRAQVVQDLRRKPSSIVKSSQHLYLVT